MSDPAAPQSAGPAPARASVTHDTNALHRAAIEALQAGRLEEALEGLTKVVALNPRLLTVYNNMGVALYRLGRFEAAAAWYRRAMQLGDKEARGNLGDAYRKLGRLAEAEACQRTILTSRPRDPNALFALSQTLRDAGRIEESLACHDELLKHHPNHVRGAWNRSLVLLQLGRFGEGFAAYEARFRRPESPARKFDVPRWTGEPLAGKTILIHDEQGFGDCLQYARFVPVVAARGGRVVFECQAPLVRLMQKLDGVVQIIARGAQPPPFEVEAPLLSLPAILGTQGETLPAPEGYIAPPDDLVARFTPLTARPAGTLKVGIVWAGRPEQRDDARRSAGLTPFSALIGVPNVVLFGLQVGPRAADISRLGYEGLIADLSPHLEDFAATAAAIKTLDLVISIDSAVTHLAGALGKPVWLALSSSGDWRYLSNRADSPWYKSLRIFRQARFGDWESVFRDIVAALELCQGLSGGRPT